MPLGGTRPWIAHVILLSSCQIGLALNFGYRVEAHLTDGIELAIIR